ncbi:MAG: 1-deoxy-D-xylulose-5-phosphate reductoisomerase [Desulfitobacteriaceae bacterium]|nr:1-deoxy-D-xylulose-5-phosphate reductoisomerase [Desulfitobacteriaceae bacterium]MDI6880188.1 1-deoxy-D-xylulose-5-phosphate reductoisomerase [Desulfitobacteriaceae bacterium]MDI6914541.1 1-deoxy-D-xylulose-5-phosphate reductoisomerase [Desulfitobacteriaceae bacterium]
MKTLTILGSTGSIGRQTLDVVNEATEKFEVFGLAAARNVDLMEEQIRRFRPAVAVMMDEKAAWELKGRLRDRSILIESGMPGLLRLVQEEKVDTVVTAVSGRIGLEPTLAALKAGKNIALANKETLVAAGELVMETARAGGCSILPVDSEHSAIFQCLEEDRGSVHKLVLTASGGPFLHMTEEEMDRATAKQALRHPNWLMGPKITIDSASLMNKGLEVIEAHHLFGMAYEAIEVLIHPQSIVHSMVEYQDGSILAQLGRPDMRLPIQYALSFPERWPNPFERLDLRGKTMTFEEPDWKKFPALALAYEVGRRGGTLPAVMNAANEEAVGEFLTGRISYPEIFRTVEATCREHKVSDNRDLATILTADAWAREFAQRTCRRG